MKKKAQTMIYDSWFLTFKVLPDEKAGQLIKAIGDHVLGKPVRLPDDLEDVANDMFDIIDEAKAAYDTKCEQMRANAKQKQAIAKQMQANADQLEGKKKKKKNEEKEKEKESKEILSKESTKKSTAFSLSRFDDELLLFPEFPDDPEVKQMFKEFIEMRNAKGKANAVNTMATFKGLVKTLLTKSEGDIETMKAMIEYSTVRGYQTFYDPKENKTITQQKTKAQVNDLDAAFERVFGKGAK